MMRNVPGLRLASRETIKAITYKLKDVKVYPGDKILRMGEINDKCFFIREGEVDVVARSVRDTDTPPQLLCRLSKGSYFNVVNSFMGRPSLFDFVAVQSHDSTFEHSTPKQNREDSEGNTLQADHQPSNSQNSAAFKPVLLYSLDQDDFNELIKTSEEILQIKINIC